MEWNIEEWVDIIQNGRSFFLKKSHQGLLSMKALQKTFFRVTDSSNWLVQLLTVSQDEQNSSIQMVDNTFQDFCLYFNSRNWKFSLKVIFAELASIIVSTLVKYWTILSTDSCINWSEWIIMVLWTGALASWSLLQNKRSDNYMHIQGYQRGTIAIITATTNGFWIMVSWTISDFSDQKITLGNNYANTPGIPYFQRTKALIKLDLDSSAFVVALCYKGSQPISLNFNI